MIPRTSIKCRTTHVRAENVRVQGAHPPGKAKRNLSRFLPTRTSHRWILRVRCRGKR